MHYIAEALSRYPVFGPHEMELPIDDIATCFQVNKILSFGDITSLVDDEYASLIAFVRGRQQHDKTGKPHIAKLFRGVMDELSIRQANGVDLVPGSVARYSNCGPASR